MRIVVIAKARERHAGERQVGDGEDGEVRQRRPQAGLGVVERRVDRLQGRAEGEQRRDRADDVVEPGGHGPGGHEGQEGDRQGEQEGQQRGGAHLARQRADRDAERAEADRAAGQRDQPEREAPPVEVHEDADAAEHDEGDREGARRGQRHLLTQQPQARDEPAHEPPERVLLALEGEHARGQQDGDEHERDGHRDRHREGVQRRAVARDHRALDRQRLADGGQHLVGQAEVLDGDLREVDDLLDVARLLGVRAAACVSVRSSAALERSRPEDVELLAQQRELRRP